MNRLCIMFVAALLPAALQITSAQQRTPQAETLLAGAQHKATVDGDLKGAIEEYKKAVAAAGSNRALASLALVRMAESYQRLGDAEAQRIYEQVLREYADQRDAVAVARAHIGPTAADRGDRTVWAGPRVDGFGTLSPDARYLTYVDWAGTAGLMIHDFTTNTDRRLTGGGQADGQTQFSTISRDGNRVAYEWMNAKRRYDLRTLDLHAAGMPEPRVVLDLEDAEEITPFDWSPDDKSLAVSILRNDRTRQIGIVTVNGGALRVLKSVDWKGPTKIYFSPDGRFIAYDLLAPDSAKERSVFVMAVDGSRDARVVEHPSWNTVMGWSRDGTRLLFGSDRTGSIDVWALPIADGKPQGRPVLLKRDVGSFWSVGLTPAGAMYVWKHTSPTYVDVMPIDLGLGREPQPASASSPVTQRFIASRGRPDWSPDGKRLAFSSCGQLGGGSCTLFVRSIDSRDERELHPALAYFQFPRWVPDGSAVLTAGTDLKGRRGLYRIDAETGAATLVDDRFVAGRRAVATDGTRVFYRATANSLIHWRNVTSGVEGDLPAAVSQFFSISPDGLQVAYVTLSGADRSGAALDVVALAGGAAKTLLRVNAPDGLWGGEVRMPLWTPDSRGLLVVQTIGAADGPKELLLVPSDGSPVKKVNLDISRWVVSDGFRLSPDGRRIAFVGSEGRSGEEIRAVDVLRPAARAQR